MQDTQSAVRISPLVTMCPGELDPDEIFSRLPPNRRGEADRRYMSKVLDDGFGNRESEHMIGPFESAFAEKFGLRFTISHNSGTGTMPSCPLAAGASPGDEVIVPACTMASTAVLVMQAGAGPAFADCDPRTFYTNPSDIERR
jgi:perosamine synthetase